MYRLLGFIFILLFSVSFVSPTLANVAACQAAYYQAQSLCWGKSKIVSVTCTKKRGGDYSVEVLTDNGATGNFVASSESRRSRQAAECKIEAHGSCGSYYFYQELLEDEFQAWITFVAGQCKAPAP